MSSEMDWELQFCLACDRQTDGNVYCSESCRLAEFEKKSPSGSAASSPTQHTPGFSWPSRTTTSNTFSLRAGSLASAHGPTPSPLQSSSFFPAERPASSPSRLTLTPSSSQSSLFSMQSASSATPPPEATKLSDESRQALRAYASSFDQSRYSRRQSS